MKSISWKITKNTHLLPHNQQTSYKPPTNPTNLLKMTNFKTRVCKNGKNCRFFASGRCTFAHPEMGEAVKTTKKKVMAFEPSRTRRKTVLCRNYPKCNFGNRCTFIHPEETAPVLRRSVADRAAVEMFSMLRERSMSLDSETSCLSKRTDLSVENAVEEDFDTIEILKQKFGDGEDYIGSWYDSSVKRDFQCGQY